MAGEGILTALQAALAGLGGGIEGAQQYRAYADKVKREKEAFDYQLGRDKEERAARLAAAQASARAEQRQAVDMGMVSASQYTGINPLDMPGATPRQPLLRQTIGGQEMVLPETKKMVEHRAGVVEALRERRDKEKKSAALRTGLANVEIGGKKLGEEQASALEVLDPNSRSIVLGALRDAARPQRIGKAEPTDDEKRRLGAQVLSTGKRNLSLINALSAVMANDPTMAGDPEMAAYTAWKSGTVQKGVTANKGFEPKKPKASGAAKSSILDDPEVVAARAAAKQGKEAPVTPATSPAPAAPPAAAPAEKKPASIESNSALDADRKLWDAAVAKHGRDRVLAEYGPRP